MATSKVLSEAVGAGFISGNSSGMSANTTTSTFSDGTKIGTASSLGMRNKIINGAMQFWQRGTTFSWDPATSGSPYTADRFLIARESTGQTGTATVSQYSLSSTEDPYAFGFTTALKVKPTATETVAAGESTYIQTRLEGYNVADFGFGTSSASPITLSFWVKSDVKTGTMCVAFYVNNDSTNASYIAEYNITTSWQKVTIVVPGNTSVIPTADNNGRFNLGFTLLSGANYQTTGNTWASSYKNATSNQINMFDSTSNAFYITGIQLEKGSVATPFEFRQYGTELALCQRYYQKSFGGSGGVCVASTYCRINLIYKQLMRATPTWTLVANESLDLSFVRTESLSSFNSVTDAGIGGAYVTFALGNAYSLGQPSFINSNNLQASAEL